jgi:hypothetical protein
MVNILVSGKIEKEEFKGMGNTEEKKIFSKLEVDVKSDQAELIEATDLNIVDLKNVILLLLRTKDDKYDSQQVQYKINLEDNNSTRWMDLKASTIIWINLEKELQLFNDVKTIKNIEISIKKPEEEKATPPATDAKKVSVVIEILTLRRILSKQNSGDVTSYNDVSSQSTGTKRSDRKSANTTSTGGSEFSQSSGE